MNRNNCGLLRRFGVVLRVRAVACVFAFLGCMLASTASNAANPSCLSKADLMGETSCNVSPCVCPTGATGYSCPTYWTLSGTTCTRSSETGSDSKGSYTVFYGSCDATTVNCYMLAPSGGAGCFCLDCP